MSKIIFGSVRAQISLHLPAMIEAEANVESGAVTFDVGKPALPPALDGLLRGAGGGALVLAPAADGLEAAAVGTKIFMRAAPRPTQIERGAVLRIPRVLSRVPPGAEFIHVSANAQVDRAPPSLRVEHGAPGTLGVTLEEISIIGCWDAVIKLAAAFRVREKSFGGAPEFAKVRVRSRALLDGHRATEELRVEKGPVRTLVLAPGAVPMTQPEGVATLRVRDGPDVWAFKILEPLVAPGPLRLDAPVVAGAEVTAPGALVSHVRQVGRTHVEGGAVGRVGEATRPGAGGRGRRVCVPGLVGFLRVLRWVFSQNGVDGGRLGGAAGGGPGRVGALLRADVGARRVAEEA